MHSNIYQLSTHQLNADEFITENTFEPEQVSDFADYVQEVDFDLSEAYDAFPFVPSMFDRKDDMLVYKGCDEAFRNWHKEVCDKVSKLSEEGLKDSMNTFRLRRVLLTPFTESRFVLTGYNDLPSPSADFLQYCAAHLEVGDILYLGGVLDFHW